MNEKQETDILLRDVSYNMVLNCGYPYVGSIFNGIVSNARFVNYKFYDITVGFEI